MRKYINVILPVIIILSAILIYLSTVGIKTNKFNNLINNKVKEFNPELSLKINEVFIKLDIPKRIVKINTSGPKVTIADQHLNLSNLEVNLDPIKFLNNENSILQIKVTTKKNSIKNLTNFLNSYQFNLRS